MLNDYVVKAIDNILDELFIAPEHDRLVWITKNTKSFMSFNHYYEGAATDTASLDTADRESVYDTIGFYFVKSGWPCYGDGKEYSEKFAEALTKNVENYNWKVRGEVYA